MVGGNLGQGVGGPANGFGRELKKEFDNNFSLINIVSLGGFN